MGSVSKHKKTNDRISSLPTNLIGYILSFLPTEDAVRTSALSTHWNQQWTLITHLDFDDLYVTCTSTSQARFVNFVYRVLLYKVRQLELFRIKCHQNYGVKHFNAWIFAALSRNVRQIDLMVPMHDYRRLETDCLFSSRTLVVLKLGEGFLVRVPTLMSLVSLKILHFILADFEDSESLTRLVSSCPVLEELELQGIINQRVKVVNISSLVLKRMILRQLLLCYPNRFELLSYEVVLNTPSLEYLKYENFLSDGYHIETLHCLERASLGLNLTLEQSDLYLDSTLVYPMVNLAVAISNVRFLQLSDYALETFCHPCANEAQLPKFSRLIALEIEHNYSELQLYGLRAFLESAPQLESLSFGLARNCEGWYEPINIPFCMRYNLKVIKVEFVDALEMTQLDIVKYFLNHTTCLKEFIISGILEQKANVIKDILMFPRVSKSCKIVLT